MENNKKGEMIERIKYERRLYKSITLENILIK